MSLQKLIAFSSSTKLNSIKLNQINRTLCSQSVDKSTKSDNTNTNKLRSSDGRWNISCGLVIQRYPLVVPELNIIEKNVYDYNLKLEYEKSLLSDYDYAIEKVRTENSKKEEYLKLASNYDKYMKDASTFRIGGKRTDADSKNDQKSHQRCLDRNLYLITKFKIGSESIWTLPFALLDKDDESLREKCDKLLEQLDSKSKFRIFGNSPFTFLKYRYPQKLKQRLNLDGNKIFYFKCQLTDLKSNLNITNNKLIEDYKWLTIDECKEVLNGKLYRKLHKGLLNENMDDLLLDMVNEKLSEKKIELTNS